jgi:hypothetical protein
MHLIWAAKSQGKKLLERCHNWKDNINMKLSDIKCANVN